MPIGPLTWLALLTFLVPLGLVAAALWLRSLTRRPPDWEAAASRLGLERQGDGSSDGPRGEARFAGELRGRDVELALRPAAPGSPTPLGVLEVPFDDGGLGLRLRRQGLLDRYGGDADHEIGDEAFDRRFVVQAARPAELAGWLDATRRRALLDAHASFTRAEAGRLVAEVPRGPGGDELEPRLVALLDLADALDSPAPAPAPEPSLEPEVAHSPPRPQREGAAADAPPPAETPVEPLPDVAADTVALALFADAAASYEVSARFDDRFRDRPVDWTGVLVDRTSTRVELELLALDPGSLAPRVVRARCDVSPAAAAALAGREGTPVRVRGRLAGCDAFLRTLTVADATLVG